MHSTATQRRNHILNNAGDVFTRAGYKASSLEMIAKEAQLSVTSLKGYFDNKQEILREIYNGLCGNIAEVLASPVAGADLVEFCCYIIDGVINVLDQSREVAWMLFVEDPPCLKKHRQKTSEGMYEAVHAMIRRLVTLELIKPEDTEAAARLCYGNAHHGIMQWLSGAWDIELFGLCVNLLLFNIRALGHSLTMEDAEQMFKTYDYIR